MFKSNARDTDRGLSQVATLIQEWPSEGEADRVPALVNDAVRPPLEAACLGVALVGARAVSAVVDAAARPPAAAAAAAALDVVAGEHSPARVAGFGRGVGAAGFADGTGRPHRQQSPCLSAQKLMS